MKDVMEVVTEIVTEGHRRPSNAMGCRRGRREMARLRHRHVGGRERRARAAQPRRERLVNLEAGQVERAEPAE